MHHVQHTHARIIPTRREILAGSAGEHAVSVLSRGLRLGRTRERAGPPTTVGPGSRGVTQRMFPAHHTRSATPTHARSLPVAIRDHQSGGRGLLPLCAHGRKRSDVRRAADRCPAEESNLARRRPVRAEGDNLIGWSVSRIALPKRGVKWRRAARDHAGSRRLLPRPLALRFVLWREPLVAGERITSPLFRRACGVLVGTAPGTRVIPSVELADRRSEYRARSRTAVNGRVIKALARILRRDVHADPRRAGQPHASHPGQPRRQSLSRVVAGGPGLKPRPLCPSNSHHFDRWSIPRWSRTRRELQPDAMSGSQSGEPRLSGMYRLVHAVSQAHIEARPREGCCLQTGDWPSGSRLLGRCGNDQRSK